MSLSQRIPDVVKIPLKFLIRPEAREGIRIDERLKKIQNNAIHRFPPDARKLIVFLIPGPDAVSGIEKISGGIISIVSLCEESARLKEIHGAEVIMCTLANERLTFGHTLFRNETEVFRFSQLKKYFRKVEEVLFHLPEFCLGYFMQFLPAGDRRWLRRLRSWQINILNQNILFMPGAEVLNLAKAMAPSVTITTAHEKYCNSHFRAQYGVPLHKFSVWISPEKYKFKTFTEKENLIIVSPDNRPGKSEVLEKIAAVPGLKMQIIQNLTYDQYKEVISRAKWALTFGEGLDGYIIEPVFSGAIGFAVYNEDFFTSDFKGVQTIYPSYTEMLAGIASDIRRLDEPVLFKEYQQQMFSLCAAHYSQDSYRANIAAFYRGEYTFP